jgi:hypothetical protein
MDPEAPVVDDRRRKVLAAIAVLAVVGIAVWFWIGRATRPSAPTTRQEVPPSSGKLEAKPDDRGADVHPSAVAEDHEAVAKGDRWIAGQVVTVAGIAVSDFKITPWIQVDWGRYESFRQAPTAEFHDPSGHFLLEGLEPGEYWLSASNRQGTGEERGIDLIQQESVEDIVIVLLPRYAVTGCVLDGASATPVEEARVTWTTSISGTNHYSWDDLSSAYDPEHSTATAADGTFRLEGVAREAAGLIASCPRFIPSVITPIPIPGPDGMSRVGIVLSRPGTIRGVVLDREGKPKPEARVVLISGLSEFDWTRSDAQGSFTFPARPGEYTVGVCSYYAQPEIGDFLEPLLDVVPVSIDEGQTAEVVLVAGDGHGSRVHGRVFLDGEALPDASVFLFRAGSGPTMDFLRKRSAKTDEEGRFEFTCVEPGKHILSTWGEERKEKSGVGEDGTPFLWVWHDWNEMSIEVEVGVEEDQEADLIEPEGEASVHVLDSAGKPLYVEVVLVPLNVKSLATEADLSRTWKRNTDKETGLAVFRRIPPGTYRVLVGFGIRSTSNQPTCAPAEAQLVVPETGKASLEVRLEKGVALDVRVLGPDGRAASGSSLQVFDGRGLPVFLCGHDEAGIFHVEGLRPGIYLACATIEDLGLIREEEVTVGSDAGTIDLRLQATATLEVIVAGKQGRPVPGAGIEFIDARGRSTGEWSRHLLVTSHRPIQVTNESGRFREEGLAPGKYRVVVDDGARQDSREVEVGEGEAVEVRVDLGE